MNFFPPEISTLFCFACTNARRRETACFLPTLNLKLTWNSLLQVKLAFQEPLGSCMDVATASIWSCWETRFPDKLSVSHAAPGTRVEGGRW